ncbi:hypothetical protein [Nonlabens agnitus]|uniref:Uncharacterized protein n=1 Tax=Nonlabens agnitus TaxID=870484 RepID=A0A2S9WXM2_9FLAO|nr:hypothetical protein [Nonlabens agnitus]PRP68126.1 hypothetical protein BST86_14025 [Nonlabens agnitus]
MEKLTIKQALKEGYTHCGSPSKEWQSLHKVEELTIADFDHQTFVLASKIPKTFTFSNDQIKELLIDVISDNEAEESGRDDDNVYEALKELDCTDISNQVDAILKKHCYWTLTDIELTF